MGGYRQRDYSPLIYLALSAALTLGLVLWARAQCYAQWPNNRPSWGPIQGCMIETREGRRIPATAVGGIDL